jgi:hypothetical protein
MKSYPTDKQLKALNRLMKTKSGRKIVQDHQEVFLFALTGGFARKPRA